MSDVFQESDALRSATDTALKRLARLNIECAAMAGRVRAYRKMVDEGITRDLLLHILDMDIIANDKFHDQPLP